MLIREAGFRVEATVCQPKTHVPHVLALDLWTWMPIYRFY